MYLFSQKQLKTYMKWAKMSGETILCHVSRTLRIFIIQRGFLFFLQSFNLQHLFKFVRNAKFFHKMKTNCRGKINAELLVYIIIFKVQTEESSIVKKPVACLNMNIFCKSLLSLCSCTFLLIMSNEIRTYSL